MPRRFPVPPALTEPPRFAWTKRRTLPTATWRRDHGDLQVVRLDPLPATFCADFGGEMHFTGPGAMYRTLSQLAALCFQHDVVLWIPCDQPAPKETRGPIVKAGGALLIAPRSCAISLKEWRNVRSKLQFVPKRWNLPDPAAIADFSMGRRSCIDIYEGKASTDGHTFLLLLCSAGLKALVHVCWSLGSEPDRQASDYSANYFVQEDKRARLRLVRWTPKSSWF